MSEMIRMAALHAQGLGDAQSYENGWRAAERGQRLEVGLEKIRSEEKRHSYRCGYAAHEASKDANFAGG
jgi:hypothetical protein